MSLQDVFSRIARTAAEREQSRTFDRELIEELKREGFTRLRVPTEFGGLGLSLPDTFAVLVDLAVADSNIAQALRPHFLAVESLLLAPDSDYRRRWLTRVGTGEIVVANALTEVGNAPGEVQTVLTDAGDHYVLSGRKFYSTGSLYADYIQVKAATDKHSDAFAFVRRNAEGVTLHDDWNGFGQKLTASGTTEFESVRVDLADVGFRDYTAPAINQALAQAHHLGTLTGIAAAIERDIAAYVRGRSRTFSHGNADLPRHDVQVQQVVGEVSAIAQSVRDILDRFVLRLDEVSTADQEGQATKRDFADIDLAAYRAQIVIAPLVLQAATQAFEVGGASATDQARGLDRHWRNARVLANHNPIIYRAKLVGNDVLNGDHQAAQYTVGG